MKRTVTFEVDDEDLFNGLKEWISENPSTRQLPDRVTAEQVFEVWCEFTQEMLSTYCAGLWMESWDLSEEEAYAKLWD